MQAVEATLVVPLFAFGRPSQYLRQQQVPMPPAEVRRRRTVDLREGIAGLLPPIGQAAWLAKSQACSARVSREKSRLGES